MGNEGSSAAIDPGTADPTWSPLHAALYIQHHDPNQEPVNHQGHAAVTSLIQQLQASQELPGIINRKAGPDGITPLGLAVQLSGHSTSGSIETLQLLISSGADIKITTNQGNNLLHICAEKGHADMCSYLIELYRESGTLSKMMECNNKDDCTPALFAAAKKNLEVLKVLTSAGASIHCTNANGWTIVHFCARNNDDALCSWIIEALRASGDLAAMINKQARFGNAPALVAAANASLNVLKLLADAGADMRATTGAQWTMLHQSAWKGAVDICAWLLEWYRGMGELSEMLDAKASNSETPATIAAFYGQVDVLKLLVEAGANIRCVCYDGWNLLHCCAKKGYEATCAWLIETYRGTEDLVYMLEGRISDGMTPALLAAANGQYNIFKLLADACKNSEASLLNAVTLEGNSALHLLVSNGHTDFVPDLLQYPSLDVNIRDHLGRTPLYIAAMKGLPEIVSLLVARQANLELSRTEELSPLQVAVLNGHLDIVRILLEGGARFGIKFHNGYNTFLSNVLLINFLKELIASGDEKDVALLQSIEMKCISERLPVLRFLVELGFHEDRRSSIASNQTIQDLVSDTTSRKASFPIHCILRRFAGTETPDDITEILHEIRSHTDKLFDIDYFGTTPLMTAIAFGANASLIEELMQACLTTKLKGEFTSPIVISRQLGDGFKFPSFRLPGVTIKDAKVCVEATLHSAKILQLGAAAADWEPSLAEGHGVGDSPKSIGMDGSRWNCYHDGNTRHSALIRSWHVGTVVGVCIDATAGVINYLFDGVKMGEDYACSFCSSDPASVGCVIAFSLSDQQGCELNLGEMPTNPLKHKPEGYVSLHEYAAKLGVPLVPSWQRYSLLASRWENIAPSEKCLLSKYYFDIPQVWSSLDDIVTACSCRVIANNHARIHEIANDLNEDGLRTADVVSKPCRQMIHSLMNFYGRYDLEGGKPEYESTNCILFLARDIETNKKVAIKLMNSEANWKRELRARDRLDQAFVIPIIATVNSDEDKLLRPELERRGYADYKYCIIMPAARKNLYQILGAENLSHKETEIRRLFEDLVLCVEHVHTRGLIHGDIKPLNIMKTNENKLILIDLDASSVIGECIGSKCSTAFVPPEMLVFDEFSRQYHVVSTVSTRDNTPLLAHPTFDVWSLGVVLYQMCSGEALFLSKYDDIDQRQRKRLFEWDTRFKREKLEKVPNSEARNLISRMLSKDPASRPSLSAILQHPFISRRRAVRLVGQAPEYDVFISYRPKTDKYICDRLYEQLQQHKNLKVWIDRMSVRDGHYFQDEFCDGLVNSRVFVCLLTTNAVADCQANKSFVTLTDHSVCDNLLLEQQLALELKQMSLLSKVFPVLIGRRDSLTADRCEPFDLDCVKNMPNTSVRSVRDKVAEHLERQRLGSPLHRDISVREVMTKLIAHQGHVVNSGRLLDELPLIAEKIADLCRDAANEEADAVFARQLMESNINSSVAGGISDQSKQEQQRAVGVSAEEAGFMQVLVDKVAALEAKNSSIHELLAKGKSTKTATTTSNNPNSDSNNTLKDDSDPNERGNSAHDDIGSDDHGSLKDMIASMAMEIKHLKELLAGRIR
jgi:ankyrin repeat protein/serine/threonine protein kinase